ncbi:energy transducer TonB [Rhizobium sp. ARZ01]|uniref:cell envelope integrity protein TolA n=1 Tax=Rhizobium sp. ARZ01 TaxID=2769313 RepID=UPI001783C395|nr:energy transducer TonB [Rhizobium sp. ARZ01]MBD9373301.1 energy transducer TonB [Rhizobium sp. ARZ01]
MVSSRVVWGTAIVFSLLTHAGAAAILTLAPEAGPETAQIVGGVVTEVAMLGSSAFEAIESGMSEEIEPSDEIEPKLFAPVPQVLAAIESQEIVPEQVMPEAGEIIPEMSEAIDVTGAAVEISAIPIPDIRPEITEKPPEVVKPPQAEAKKPAEKKPEKKAERNKKKAGEKGDSTRTERRGQIDGAADVKTASLGGQKKGNSSAAGNAAVSNYPGKVRNKINRVKRRVGGAGSGIVMVSFTVSASGDVSSVRVAASSGQPELDQAALDAVRRAAPFPDIPEDAGRSSWPFSVPIAFKR